MSARRILLLGNLKGTAMAALEGAARQINAVLTHHSRADEAIRDLDVREWRAVLVDITTPGASRFCHEARARRALFNVPLIGMTPQLSDLAFSNAFRWGADDVVLLGLAGPLVARLESLPESIALEDPGRGEAVVADADRGRCDVLGRVLANAGYSVRYATDLVSARYYIGKRGVTLFVFSEELGSPPQLIEQALAQGSSAYWIVAAKQRHLDDLRDALKKFDRVAVMSAHGPPENVLFALDFLSPSAGAQRRSQVRALHGTMVHFRSEGEEDDECGYTYSVSASGMYVRTLLPPPTGNLWLEIEPPRSARRVRLLGSVAWSRTFGQSGAETAPPGFGVKLAAGLGHDLDVWLEGFRSLDAAKPDTHVVPEVKFTPQPFKVPLPGTLSQPPRTPYVSRKSSPIIAITGVSEAEKFSVPETVPFFPSGVPERPARESVVLSPSMAPLLDALTPIDSDAPPRTELMHPRIPRPDPGTLRGSLAPLLNQRLAGELTAPAPAPKLDLSQTIPLLGIASPEATPGARRDAHTNGAGHGTTPLEAAAEAWGSTPQGPPTVAVVDLPTIAGLGAPEPAAGPPPKPEMVTGELHQEVSPPVIVLGPDAMLPLESTELPQELPPEEADALPVAPAESFSPSDVGGTDAVITRNSHTEIALLSAEPRRPSAQLPQDPNSGGALPHLAPVATALPSVTEDAATEPAPIEPDGLRRSTAPAPDAGEPSPALASEAPAAPSKAPSSIARGAAIALGLALVAAVVGGVWMMEAPRGPKGTAGPVGSTATTPSAAGATSSSAFAESTSAAAEPGATETPSPTSSGTAEPGHAEASSQTPQPTTQLPETEAPSSSELAEDESWLRVTSAVDAAVFVHGIDLGRTNEWLKSRCGMRFIRLGASPGRWLSEGIPHRLACQQAISIAIDPTAAREPTAPEAAAPETAAPEPAAPEPAAPEPAAP